MSNRMLAICVTILNILVVLLLVPQEHWDIVAIVVAALVLWYVIGKFVISAIDNDEGELTKWSEQAPYGLEFLVVSLFPIILVFWIKAKREGRWHRY